MKVTRKELEELLYWDEHLEVEEEPEEELEEELDEPLSWEEAQSWREEMKRLAIAGLAGDDEAWSIWSDMWKDMYGSRPRYSDAEIRWMYGLEEA